MIYAYAKRLCIMAAFRKCAAGWRAEVCCAGVRKSKTLRTKPEAKMWAARIEAELRAKATLSASELYTLDNLFTRYADEVAPLKKGVRWDTMK